MSAPRAFGGKPAANNAVSRENMEYDSETDRWYPRIDEHATYEITNLQPGPFGVAVRNESGSELQTMTLAGNETVEILGNRMTKFVWELDRRKMIRVRLLGVLPTS